MSDQRVEPLVRRAAPRPGSPTSLREANQRRVIQVLREDQDVAVSQAQIARTTGLAPATVSNIVRDLTTAGLVEISVGAGRRGSTVRIARAAGTVVGIDVGHRHLRVAVADMAGAVLARRTLEVPPDHSQADALVDLEHLVKDVLTSVGGSLADVHCIGMGIPAPINNDGVVMSSAILPSWVGVKAPALVSAHFDKPTYVDNDANLGALAEHRRGSGRGHGDMVFVKVSSGVGAGLIIDGEVYRGANGTAGEIGHLPLDEQGPLCRCGSRGCLEAYTSSAVAEALLLPHMPESTIDQMISAAGAGHLAARRTFEDAGLHLGWGLAMLANVTNPDTIVVGGDMVRAGELFLEPVRTGLRRHALSSVGDETEVVAAQLGDQASLIGAVLLALEHTDLLALQA